MGRFQGFRNKRDHDHERKKLGWKSTGRLQHKMFSKEENGREEHEEDNAQNKMVDPTSPKEDHGETYEKCAIGVAKPKSSPHEREDYPEHESKRNKTQNVLCVFDSSPVFHCAPKLLFNIPPVVLPRNNTWSEVYLVYVPQNIPSKKMLPLNISSKHPLSPHLHELNEPMNIERRSPCES